MYIAMLMLERKGIAHKKYFKISGKFRFGNYPGASKVVFGA